MERDEADILHGLDAAVRSAGATIEPIVAGVDRRLNQNLSDVLAWQAIPLECYDAHLPRSIRSSWVFVLRANVATGAERHPNSHQRMMSYRGRGDFQTQPSREWCSHHLTSDPAAPLEARWISIPPNVWHQGVVGPENWAVVSFHTVAEHELVEERPAIEATDAPRQRKYAANLGPEPTTMSDPYLEFRPLTESDLPRLHSWLNRPHVLDWWNGESSLEEVRVKYLPRTSTGPVRPYLAYLGSEPIGYIQSYVAVETEDGWWTGYTDPSVLGIDQFLADPDRLGQGLGTAMVSHFAALLFRDASITRLQVDPRPDNARAIRSYEKAGFRSEGVITTPDGPALLMIATRSSCGLTRSPGQL